MKIQEIQPLIIEWAKEKNLIHAENVSKQRLKLIEETGELASAILKNNIENQKDAIGDIFVVLVILAEQQDYKINYNFQNYNENTIISLQNIMFSGVNDSLSYLICVAEKLKLDLTECVNLAWNEIKDRKGQTINGTFIKN
jgi:NTP pyrophosphatase (non-canonical NTP hydrolase)